MNKEKTGQLIREARIKKNYTQSELGDLLGVTNKAVSRWEKGEKQRYIRMCVCNIFDFMLSYIRSCRIDKY